MTRTEVSLALERTPGIRRAGSSVIILAAIFLFSFLGINPPSAKHIGAPPSEFSADRAVQVLGRILLGDTPHPVGSSTDELVRSRVMTEFTRMGYQPQVQSAFDCNAYGLCAAVNNVVARLNGTDVSSDGDAILLAAHYDSVAAGPGASDDGAGVASLLEIARALKSIPPARHSIIFLADEGEEAGLIGARAFVDFHPWAKEVRAAINLDARGSSGPSLLFETGAASEWAIRLFESSAQRPVTSSIFYAVYRQMPNDTDMTVFKSAGKQGANFAYVGNAAQYHTPLDNRANLISSTIQQQGENALGLVEAFANTGVRDTPETEAVFFDLFGRRVFEWPQSRALPMAGIAGFFLLVQITLLLWRKRMSWRQLLSGATAFLMTLVTVAALSLILRSFLRLTGSIPVDWIAHPTAVRLAFWLLALSVVLVHGIAFARKAAFWGLWTGVWIWWTIIGLIVSGLQPGMSYVIDVPLCVAAFVGFAVTVLPVESATLQWLAGILPMAAAACVGFAPLILLYQGMGTPILALLAILVGLILTPLLPLCVDLSNAEGLLAVSLPGVPILATGLAIFAAAIVPAYSAQNPERVNLAFWQDADSGKAQWIVTPSSARMPGAIGLVAPFRDARTGEVPWNNAASFLSDAPAIDAGAPTFTVLDSTPHGTGRRFEALLRSERGAPVGLVIFPGDSGVEDVRMEGVALPPESPVVRERANGAYIYGSPSMTTKGVEMSFTLPAGKPVMVTVLDQSYDLPGEGAFLAKARPLTAVPSGEGDLTIVSRRVQLNP